MAAVAVDDRHSEVRPLDVDGDVSKAHQPSVDDRDCGEFVVARLGGRGTDSGDALGLDRELGTDPCALGRHRLEHGEVTVGIGWLDRSNRQVVSHLRHRTVVQPAGPGSVQPGSRSWPGLSWRPL